MDSGATRTLVGLPGYEVLQKLNFKLIKHSMFCSVANGQTCESIGFMQVPVTLMGKTRFLDILVMPKLSHKLILGVDFWQSMEIVHDLKQNVWHFSDIPKVAVSKLLTI